MGSTKVPKRRLGRLARLAEVGVRAGTHAVLKRDGEGAAQHAAEVLGNLRGIAAKVGQMAGYIDGVVPEKQRDSYEKWMKGLLAAAPKSSPEDIRKTVLADLGKPADEVFATWNDDPIASASIGQVHRATLHDGTEVAVKVQHHQIAKAVESDLKNAGLLEGAVGMMAGKKFESKRIMKEIRQRFREELDYELEAERQQIFADLHADDPTIRIPKIFHDFTSKRVLTSEFVSGRNFDEAIEAPPNERAAWCETMWRFVYKGNLVGGMFNADPHPGNYIFGEDGKVYFLDFGCVQKVPDERRRKAVKIHEAVLRGDEAGFRDASKTMLDLQGGRYEPRVLSYMRECFEPQFGSPFRITREYSSNLASHMGRVFNDSRKDKHDKFVPIPDGMFFLNRLQFGFYSVLARLNVEVDYASVERGFMGEAGEA